ncbi:uncharacterized [Tachysurus ichikawai]
MEPDSIVLISLIPSVIGVFYRMEDELYVLHVVKQDKQMELLTSPHVSSPVFRRTGADQKDSLKDSIRSANP